MVTSMLARYRLRRLLISFELLVFRQLGNISRATYPRSTVATTVRRGTVQYRLCFEMAWWTTPRYSVTFAVAILRIEYCNVRTSARFHEVVSVCVTASRYTLLVATGVP